MPETDDTRTPEYAKKHKTKTVEEKILEMLRDTGIEKDGYSIEGISFLIEWNGCDIYRFHLSNDKPLKIGTPWFYLVKNDEITVTTFNQALRIMAKHSRETGGRGEYDKGWDGGDALNDANRRRKDPRYAETRNRLEEVPHQKSQPPDHVGGLRRLQILPGCR